MYVKLMIQLSIKNLFSNLLELFIVLQSKLKTLQIAFQTRIPLGKVLMVKIKDIFGPPMFSSLIWGKMNLVAKNLVNFEHSILINTKMTSTSRL